MTAREAFGVFIRVLGVVGLLLASADLFHIAASFLGHPELNHYPLPVECWAAAYYAAIGITLLVGANVITRLVYGRPDNSN